MSGEIRIDHELFEQAVYDGLHDGVWNVLPKGSHLVLEGRTGAEVFAFRHRVGGHGGDVVEVLTNRGEKVELGDTCTLRLG